MEFFGEILNAETLDVDATLDTISRELKSGETLILDISNASHHQTDVIYDKLITRGYEVKKLFSDGKNQILISRKL